MSFPHGQRLPVTGTILKSLRRGLLENSRHSDVRIEAPIASRQGKCRLPVGSMKTAAGVDDDRRSDHGFNASHRDHLLGQSSLSAGFFSRNGEAERSISTRGSWRSHVRPSIAHRGAKVRERHMPQRPDPALLPNRGSPLDELRRSVDCLVRAIERRGAQGPSSQSAAAFRF